MIHCWVICHRPKTKGQDFDGYLGVNTDRRVLTLHRITKDYSEDCHCYGRLGNDSFAKRLDVEEDPNVLQGTRNIFIISLSLRSRTKSRTVQFGGSMRSTEYPIVSR